MADRDLSHLMNAHSQSPSRDSVSGWEDEVDLFLSKMQAWPNTEPDLVMKEISAAAARLIEIRCQVVRSENRQYQSFRTKQLDPLLDQLKFQFNIHSRLVSTISLDWDMAKGG